MVLGVLPTLPLAPSALRAPCMQGARVCTAHTAQCPSVKVPTMATQTQARNSGKPTQATQAPAQAPAPVAGAPVAQAAATPATPAVPAAPAAPLPYANAAWAPTLPKSLVAKGATLLAAPKGTPAHLQGVTLLPGKPFVARSAHNAAWAATAVAVAQAAAPVGATPAQLVAAGVGMHSIVAYVKRGWLVPAPKQAA